MKPVSPELAYLLGAMRDASIDVRKGKNYEIKIAQRETSWLRLLQTLFHKEFEARGTITKHANGTEILRINGRSYVEKILDISDFETPQEFWDTPKCIKEQKVKIQIHYLKGFFDAEGGLPKKPDTAKQKYISFSQKNRESLEFIRQVLIDQSCQPTNITFCGNVWEFRLTRKNNLLYFCKNIGSWHKDKQLRLKLLNDGITFP
ncbi:MAG: hypothetical protein HYW26_01470 [Candidatus Aenigmarchaeota archaeon]|nr:hypothetical protein [Candidatus Aenigmarchaeota archaeon]